MIPVEAVEAAAKALAEQDGRGFDADSYRADAKFALEAAAPYIQSAAWDEGWDAGMRFQPNKTNPYRTSK